MLSRLMVLEAIAGPDPLDPTTLAEPFKFKPVAREGKWKLCVLADASETDQPEVWVRLGALINAEWSGHFISRMCVDHNYRKQPVEEFCRQHRAIAAPTMGHDHQEKPFKANSIDVNIRGRIIKDGLQLWHFDADVFKSWVHSRVQWPEDHAHRFFRAMGGREGIRTNHEWRQTLFRGIGPRGRSQSLEPLAANRVSKPARFFANKGSCTLRAYARGAGTGYLWDS